MMSTTSAVGAVPSPTTNTKITKPFLKWLGGKTQIIEEVMARFPPTLNNYHEPFLGGGSVLLALLSYVANGAIKMTGKIYASDINPTLIGLYRNIQTNPGALIAEVKLLMDEVSACEKEHPCIDRKASSLKEAQTSPESYYYWIRLRFNMLSKEDRGTIPASAMFLFMNKTSFRGMYREGPHGFNVPYGNYKNPAILDEEHILHISALLKDVVFTVHSFPDAFSRVVAGDFMYLDPPYAPETTTSFVSYTSDGFDINTHKTLFAHCAELKKKKVNLLMSNADVSLVKDAFPAPLYTTTVISCRRAIHSREPDSRTNEVLITNNGD
jgi:DNA adenine methylase